MLKSLKRAKSQFHLWDKTINKENGPKCVTHFTNLLMNSSVSTWNFSAIFFLVVRRKEYVQSFWKWQKKREVAAENYWEARGVCPKKRGKLTSSLFGVTTKLGISQAGIACLELPCLFGYGGKTSVKICTTEEKFRAYPPNG